MLRSVLRGSEVRYSRFFRRSQATDSDEWSLTILSEATGLAVQYLSRSRLLRPGYFGGSLKGDVSKTGSSRHLEQQVPVWVTVMVQSYRYTVVPFSILP